VRTLLTRAGRDSVAEKNRNFLFVNGLGLFYTLACSLAFLQLFTRLHVGETKTVLSKIKHALNDCFKRFKHINRADFIVSENII
jgi:hypothetical protein